MAAGHRIAALYDIHGNLPALEAVLEEVRGLPVDGIVVGGDVLPGPLPRETLERLFGLDLPVQFIHGNGELAALAQFEAADAASVRTGAQRPVSRCRKRCKPSSAGAHAQIFPDYRPLVVNWPRVVRVDVLGLGEVLFCHGTPRSEVECFTRLTNEHLLLPVFEAAAARR